MFIKKLMSVLMAGMMLVGCGSGQAVAATQNLSASGEITPIRKTENGTAAGTAAVHALMRPGLLDGMKNVFTGKNSGGSLGSYYLEPDLSNVIPNGIYLSEEMQQLLVKNLFAVNSQWGNFEFHEIYENNRYSLIPSFITTDSILHTYHLFFAYLQKNTERDYLRPALGKMSDELYNESLAQLEALRGTEWEEAAQRNVDFFSVGIALAGGNIALSERAQQELDNIENGGMSTSVLFSTETREYLQDYSQFKPRGYYTENGELESYFRSMMWYGQMNFASADDQLSRSAVLACDAIHNAGMETWNSIYTITAFFAGESDDNGFYEYWPVIETVYGEHTYSDLSDASKSEACLAALKLLEAPRLNSMLVYEREDRDEVTAGFRLLGQRFTLDGYIMQRLVYRDLDASADGGKRMMPNALDVPAALGSDAALSILKTTTDVDRWDYTETVLDLREEIAGNEADLYGSSIRSGWLGTLVPLLQDSPEGSPAYTQSKAWTDRKLNTFLGSYTELKHDTVLYDKQIMAEMGAAGLPDYDDRGYVETEPEVFGRLEAVAQATVSGLQNFGMISEEDVEYMEILQEICGRLKTMAEKELRGELLSEEEFEFIRTYGAQLDHFWIHTVSEDGKYTTMERPAAVVVDIATNGESGTCLEIGTGAVSTMIVAVEFDGEIHLCQGGVYSFYQFEQPVTNRLTDEQWRELQEKPGVQDWQASFAYNTRYGTQTSAGGVSVALKGDSLGEVYILVDKLNSRSEPSTLGDKLDKVLRYETYPVYEVEHGEGYTWYRIGENRWIADQDGEWVSYTPN